jgi:hypothetical protein
MGSHNTLDHHQLAAEALQLEPDDWSHGHAIAHELDHPNSNYDHTDPTRDRAAEQAFDQLNPEFGVPADQHNPYGRQAVRDREDALALGVRVAVHDSRQNDPNPVIWQPGQNYRAADAIQTARRDLVRTRHGPERVGPER